MRERSDFQKKPMYYPLLPAEIPLSEKPEDVAPTALQI